MPLAPFPSARRTLESWKEIAEYLHVTVRTAQRWRDEGLPVHYLGTGPKARLVAYSDELDEWIRSGRYKNAGSREMPRSSHFPGWLVPALLSALLLVLILGGLWLYQWYFIGSIPDHLTVEEEYLAAYDKQNRLCWRQPVPGINPDAYKAQSSVDSSIGPPTHSSSCVIADIEGDGRIEVLFTYWPKSLYESSGKLCCFEQDGSVRWEFRFGRKRFFGERELSSNYLGNMVRLVHAHGKNWILSVSHHDHWFPAHAVVHDPETGQIHQEYWHPGWIQVCNAFDLDNDGSQEILLAGVNNPGSGLGHIGLAVLKVAATQQKPVPDRVGADIRAFTGGSELAYCLFPRSDILTSQGLVPQADVLAIVDGKQIMVRTNGPDKTDVVYHLDFSLNQIEFRISDGFAGVHELLRKRGLLDHALTEAEIAELGKVKLFRTAPDGNSPEIKHLWKLP